jgi:hypothetical protein
VATVSITVPDVLVPRLTTAMRAKFPQYSGLTDAQTFKKVTGEYWRSILANYEGDAAGVAAQTQANSDSTGIG